MNNKLVNLHLQKLKILLKKNILPPVVLFSDNIKENFQLAIDFSRWIFCDFVDKSINNNLEITCDCSGCKIFLANNHPDYFLIDLGVEQEIKIDLIRQVNHFINSKGYLTNKRILLINNFQNINNQAANAFLKTLEEPPLETEVLFLLNVNNSKTLPKTILSRVFDFAFLNQNKNNLQKHKELEILTDLYNIWVKDLHNFVVIIDKWQLLPKRQLSNCLWFIMTKIIKASKPGTLLELKEKISPNLVWKLLDSLNYLNKMIILNQQINWQLFLYNFIMAKFTGENIYVRRTRF